VSHVATPEPVEFALPRDGLTLRGLRWPGGDHAVVLVHDPGADLDSWQDLPEDLTQAGYTVLAFDLPGHGLSDGDWRLALLDPAVAAALGFALNAGARAAFLIAAGVSAMTTVPDFRARVALSPRLISPDPAPSRLPPSPTLILAGSGDDEREQAQRFFRVTTDWAVLSTFGGAPSGAALLRSDWAAQAREQIRTFLADYRLR